MNKHDLLDVIGEAQEQYILRTARTRGQGQGSTCRSRKSLFLIAAAVAMALLLVGCGVFYLLGMQSLKIEDREWADPYHYTGETVTQRILALGGPQGTVNYQAAKEWYEFEVPYAQNHDWDESFPCPPDYEFYYPYTQEMVDKLNEISEKYGLKLMGPEVKADSTRGMLSYLGIEDILLPGVAAKVEDLGVSYFEEGHLTLGGSILMEEEISTWPFRTHTRMFMNPKDCFSGSVFVLDEPEKWQEWNYTTASGENLLVLYNPDFWEAYAVCDRGDAMVCLMIQTARMLYTNDRVSDEIMTPEQVEDLLDIIDFSIDPEPGDKALLSGLPAGYDTASRVQTQEGYTVELVSAISDGNMAWITLKSDKGQVSFGRKELSLKSEETYPHMGGSYLETGEYVICWYDPDRPDSLGKGMEYTLTLEGMHPAVDPGDGGYDWQTDALWKFDFTFDEESDFRKLIFISQPTELPCEEGEGTMTVASLVLHSRSAVLQLEEEVGVRIPDWTVVLKDGTSISLREHSGTALDETNTVCIQNLEADGPIPLEEVDYILLNDGAKLYPLK